MSISEALGVEREVRLPQGVVRYRERGKGRSILFIHGFVTNGDLWRKVVPGLSGQYRCITPDWPLGSHSVAMDPGADLSPSGLVDLIAEFLEHWTSTTSSWSATTPAARWRRCSSRHDRNGWARWS